MLRYPIATVTADRQVVNAGWVNMDTLTEQLLPIRDAFLELFERAPAKSRGELHRLELGLAVTEQGIAFATGDTRPSLTLTLQSRQRSPRSNAAKKPDVVEIG